MRLIGAGLPRTGTLSQKVALEMLGFAPCYHMVNVLADLDLVPQWRRALDGDADWEQIFNGFDATVDWPGSFFYEELLEVFPDAKVLLSVRDGQSWARSMRDTIWGLFYDDILIQHISSARAVVDPKWAAYLDMMKGMWERSGLLSGEQTTAEWMSDAMARYHEQVRTNVPADRLLVWTPADGWESLCDFLEVPVPDQPFPHLNDSTQFGERIVDGSLLAIQEWRAAQQNETEQVTATP
jgi:hypothetical protein